MEGDQFARSPLFWPTCWILGGIEGVSALMVDAFMNAGGSGL